MKINQYLQLIKKLGACEEAVLDAHNYKTSQELWADCKRGDWMLWLMSQYAGESGCDKRKQLVLTACKCARLSLPYVEKGELRPLRAIEAAEAWARDESISLDNVRKAANVAACAANAAAFAAVCAAYTAYVTNAFYVANAAAYAANATRGDTLSQCADIVRADYPDIDLIMEEK